METVSSSVSSSVIAPVEAVLREIFEKYSKLYDGGLSLEEFAQLLVDTRGLPLERATAEASSLFATFESVDYVDSDEEFLGYPAFARHMLTNSIQEQRKTPLDLKQPLTHYFIKSISAGSDYYHPRDLRKVLHDGFRWIEWNCYVDQVNNQPVFASHASSATQLGVRKALEIIVQDGFRTTSLPLVLSINVFCSFDHQSKLASWLKSELGDLLAKLPRKRGQVPTPAELQNKVLLCVVDTPTAVSANIQSLLLPDSVTCIPTSRSALDAELTARQAFPYPAAAELVELAHFSHQDQPNTDTAEYRSVCAIPEAIAASSPLSVVQYTSRCLLHQTPLPQRFAFSNQNPQLGWSLGAQVADVNPFVNDAVSQLNHGVFSQNAQCGYTLKPFGMRSPPFVDPSHEINLNCQLRIDFFGLNDAMKTIRCPVVSLEAQVHGHASEAVFFKISNLSVSTTWKESVVLQMNKSSTSMLRLSLVDQSTGSAVAYFCASVNSLLTGLCVIPLTAVLSHRPIEAGLLCMVTLGDEKPQSTIGELGRFSSLHRQSTNLALLKKDQPKSILKKKEKPVDPNAPKKRDWVSLRKTPSQLQPKRRVPMPPMESLVKTITNAEVEELRELAAALHLPENLHRDDSSPDEALACVLQVVNTLHVSRDKQVRFLLPTDHEARVRRRAARNALKKWVRKIRPGATSHRPASGGGIDADKIPTKATAESKEAQQKRAARQWGDNKMATAALGTEREQIASDSDSDEEDMSDSEEWYSSEEEDDDENGDLSENPFDFSGFSGALGMRLDTLQEQDLAQDIRAANLPLSPATRSGPKDVPADKASVSSTLTKEEEEKISPVSSVSSASTPSPAGVTSTPLDAEKKPKKGSAIRSAAGGKARLISMGYSSSSQDASTTRETLDDVQTEEEEEEEYDYESEEFTDEEMDPEPSTTTTTTTTTKSSSLPDHTSTKATETTKRKKQKSTTDVARVKKPKHKKTEVPKMPCTTSSTSTSSSESASSVSHKHKSSQQKKSKKKPTGENSEDVRKSRLVKLGDLEKRMHVSGGSDLPAPATAKKKRDRKSKSKEDNDILLTFEVPKLNSRVFSFSDLRLGYTKGMKMEEYIEAVDSFSNRDNDKLMDADELEPDANWREKLLPPARDRHADMVRLVSSSIRSQKVDGYDSEDPFIDDSEVGDGAPPPKTKLGGWFVDGRGKVDLLPLPKTSTNSPVVGSRKRKPNPSHPQKKKKKLPARTKSHDPTVATSSTSSSSTAVAHTKLSSTAAKESKSNGVRKDLPDGTKSTTLKKKKRKPKTEVASSVHVDAASSSDTTLKKKKKKSSSGKSKGTSSSSSTDAVFSVLGKRSGTDPAVSPEAKRAKPAIGQDVTVYIEQLRTLAEQIGDGDNSRRVPPQLYPTLAHLGDAAMKNHPRGHIPTDVVDMVKEFLPFSADTLRARMKADTSQFVKDSPSAETSPPATTTGSVAAGSRVSTNTSTSNSSSQSLSLASSSTSTATVAATATSKKKLVRAKQTQSSSSASSTNSASGASSSAASLPPASGSKSRTELEMRSIMDRLSAAVSALVTEQGPNSEEKPWNLEIRKMLYDVSELHDRLVERVNRKRERLNKKQLSTRTEKSKLYKILLAYWPDDGRITRSKISSLIFREKELQSKKDGITAPAE